MAKVKKVSKKKSKKVRKLFRIGVLILVIILLVLLVKFVFGLFKKAPEKVSLIIGDTKIELKKDILIDDDKNIYLSKDDIAYLYDENIYYNPTDKTVITTYNKHIAVLSMNKTTMTINDTAVSINGALKEEKGVLYLPFSDMIDVYDFEYTYDKENKALTVDSTNKGKSTAVVLKKVKLKEDVGLFAKKIEKIEKAEIVTVFERGEKYSKIRTNSGNIGYVKTKALSENERLRDDFDDEKILNIKVFEEYNEISSELSSVQVNENEFAIVNPNLFNINSEFEVNQVISLESEKFKNYKVWAENNNIRICANVDFSGSMNALCSTYNSRTLVINNIYRELIKNQINCVNIDFNTIDDTEGFYRFIIEMVPRFKEAGIKVFVTYKDGMNKERLEKIVDYVL